MLFNSYGFIFIFLPLTWVVYRLLSGYGLYRWSLVWLTTASLFFYGWWNPRYLALLSLSILLNYFLGSWLVRTRLQGEGGRRRVILVGGLIFNLALLGYFKYFNFFLSNVNGLFHSDLRWESIVLPLGISFFTFQKIAYLVDAYRGDIETTDFLEYALFVSFFPQLIAGPIVHHKEIMPQFQRASLRPPNIRDVTLGLLVFFVGLFHKTVLADSLAPLADRVFEVAQSGVKPWFAESWAGALAYTFQLYFDFAGYSYMALGLGTMFAIRLPQNFDSPYQAANIIDFWRRWHMTLSRFLRDYIYFPLGGNRKGPVRRYVNLMAVMLIGGLWHGAGWTYVTWGALHGIYLCINHGWQNWRTGKVGALELWGGKVLTFIAIVVGWVFFRASDFNEAWLLLRGMSGLGGIGVPVVLDGHLQGMEWLLKPRGFFVKLLVEPSALFVLAAAGGIVFFGPGLMQIAGKWAHDFCRAPVIHPGPPAALRFKWSLGWALAGGGIAALALAGLVRESPFLYFQF